MKKNIVIILILILIVIIVLISTKYYFSQKRTPSISEEEAPEEEQKIILPKILYNLTGVIHELNKGSLLFEASIPQIDENGQPVEKTETREAKITQLTKFTQLTFIETEPGRKIPKETPITFQDFKIGDYIEVISNQDISQAEEFEATQIRILPK